jgi:hypothetical protein
MELPTLPPSTPLGGHILLPEYFPQLLRLNTLAMMPVSQKGPACVFSELILKHARVNPYDDASQFRTGSHPSTERMSINLPVFKLIQRIQIHQLPHNSRSILKSGWMESSRDRFVAARRHTLAGRCCHIDHVRPDH